MTVRTRFAPSPTGLLHIGSARTALFNYLFARHHGGAFLLRIEDTDRERSTDAATQVILEGLDWLGLNRDEQTVFQSTRAARHAEVAHELLAQGKAYYCYCTAEELRQMREQAIAEGRSPRYDGRWRDRDPSQAPPGVKPSIRLKAPQQGDTAVEDLVQGTVRVANSEMDDLIILRSDGTPTYLHAVVVDDHDMAITHVIRGDDHLTNTFRQVQIYQAMGWDQPAFAHIPLIHGADGAKLSKRHGAVSVLEFREQGFLPEAVCNYLIRLGWSHGDLEVVDRDEAIRLFDIHDVNRGASRMDYAKLTHLNGIYIRKADDDRLTRDVLHRLAHRPDLSLGSIAAGRIRALMPQLKERAKTLVELADSAAFLARVVPLPMEPKAAGQLTAEARLLLRDLGPTLAATDFSPPALDAALREFANVTGRKLGQVAQPLRAALTGSTVSPGIDATLAALGRDEALTRIAAAVTPEPASGMVDRRRNRPPAQSSQGAIASRSAGRSTWKETRMSRVFITGSADGLGLLAARLLVDQGHAVTLHARNDARAADTRRSLPQAAAIVVGDLSRIADTRSVAEQVNALGRHDAVIHNAGIGYRQSQRVETSDGLAQLFAVNVLAPYLLTALITPPDRLIYLSSGMHNGGNPALDDPQWTARRWNGSQAYSDSKLLDAVLAFAVARRWPTVLSNAVEPGWVPTKMGGPGAPDDLTLGAVTQAWLAVSDDKTAKVTGQYFFHQKPRRVHQAARRTELQDALLDYCAGLTGVAIPDA